MRLFMIFCVVFLLAGCDTRTSVERAQEDGILIVGNNTEPQSFDPHVATSVSDFKIINAVMEGLLRGDSRKDSVSSRRGGIMDAQSGSGRMAVFPAEGCRVERRDSADGP